MLIKVLLVLAYCRLYECNIVSHYDTYTGGKITEEEYKEHVKKNTTFWCVKDIVACDPNEWSRVDGSCNNLQHPSYGAIHTPQKRILPAAYDTDFEPRRAKDGSPLPLARYLRTSLMPQGKVPDQVFTQLVTYILPFFTSDAGTLQDTINYVLWKPYCCEAKGKCDRSCIPNKVPDLDPVHRFSNVRCMNLTRPESFQSMGCTKNDTTPDRIVSSTPTIDLSTIYGNSMESLNKKGRQFEKGLLKSEFEDGREWPPSTNSKINICLLNQKPAETRCHSTPEDGSNSIAGINIFTIWFWRHHNYIARALSKTNPCWGDERLFYTARDINIAMYIQILLYELFPLLMGKDNLANNNIISYSPGFRDMYDDQLLPQMSAEFSTGFRWFHAMQEGSLKMFDLEGNYLRKFPIVNMTLRTGFLAVDNNIDYITQGSFRQPCAKADYVVDPDISEVILGPFQRAADVFTSDLAKNRYFGFQPYVKYKQFCNNKNYASFDDLLDSMDPERVEMLKDRYKDVEDIDLLAGLWLEKHIDGGYIPSTLFCLISEQMLRSISFDRHWYERPNRPHAFNYQQLAEIRKSSISRLLCDVADKVTKIQPKGFLRAGSGNQIQSCERLQKINFNAWADNSCCMKKS
ncbi:hypothetical protein ACJJTC_010691 [Scirpophaga incertulas]